MTKLDCNAVMLLNGSVFPKKYLFQLVCSTANKYYAFLYFFFFVGHDNQATGFKIYNMLNNTSELIHENTARTGNRFTIELNSTVVMRKINITDNHPISICELKLLESGK